jgi:hypothetical protein
MISRLHRLLLELIPGGARVSLSAAQARALLARVRPQDAAGKMRERVAAELVSDLERIYQRKKAAGKELREMLAAAGSTPAQLHGTGHSGAARLLAEVGDITRVPTRPTSRPGTAPRPSTPPPDSRSGTGSPAPATGRSTARCTSWPSSSRAIQPKAVPATTAKSPRARPPWKPCER